MKILQCVAKASGGMRAHALELSYHLALSGHQVTLLAVGSAAAWKAEQERLLGALNTTDFPGFELVLVDNFSALCRRFAQIAAGAQIVHAHGMRSGAILKKAHGAYKIVTIHNTYRSAYGGINGRARTFIARLLFHRCLKNADLVLPVSPDISAESQQYLERTEKMPKNGARPHVELALIPPPASLQAALCNPSKLVFAPDLADGVEAQAYKHLKDWKNSGGYAVVTLARLTAQKGLDTLLEVASAFTQLVRDSADNTSSDAATFMEPAKLAAGKNCAPQLHFYVLGDGPLQKHLEAEILRRDLPITIVGRSQNVFAWLKASDLALSVAKWEGQPVWLQEACALSVPIVATDVGGVRATVQDGAKIVSTNSAEIVRALKEIFSQPKMLENMREKSKNAWLKRPTWADAAAQVTSKPL